MSRPAIVLATLLVLLVALLVFFAGRSGERAQTHVEKVVAIGNLAD